MMTNMFSFSFALTLFIIFGIYGQYSNSNALPSETLETAALFGQLQHLIDNQNPDQQPPISCFRIRPNIKNAHPTDNTKYFICRDERRYEILTCPNGGIFDNQEKACIDLCEQKKPCLNQGQCIILSNLTLQCVCRQDWIGEQCEIPLSTCATNPCGPNGQCHMLKTSDYSQDYVCICNNHRSYGRNCQQTVPNPCLMNLQQFHPFAFSRQAYINCDDELIFFQPCNAKLYWNQEDKRCDRSLPLLLRAPFINLRNRNQQPQQNFLTLSQGLSTQQWSNQMSDNPPQTNQRFATQSQPWQGSLVMQNQDSLTNTFMETTTEVPKIFHLMGFSSRNSGQQNNANNQIQSSGDFQTQSINKMPFQQNNQFELNQQQSWQNSPNSRSFQTFSNQPSDLMMRFNSQNLATSSPETTTVANKDLQQGFFVHTLTGWKTNQQESLDQQKTLDSIPTFQTGSWKA